MTTSEDSFSLLQDQAASVVDHLHSVWSGYDTQRRHLGMVSDDERSRIIQDVLNQIYSDATKGGNERIGTSEEVRTAALDVKSALKQASVRQRICTTLRSLTGKTSRDVTFETTKALLPLAIAGQIAVPATPLAIGILGFAAVCIGASWLCSDCK